MIWVTSPSTSPSAVAPISGASMSTRRALFWRGICDGPWPSVSFAIPESGTASSDCEDGRAAPEPRAGDVPVVALPDEDEFGSMRRERSESSVRRWLAGSWTMIGYWQTNGTQYPIMVQLPASQRRTLDSLGSLLIEPNSSSSGSATTGTSPALGSGAAIPSSQSLDAVPLSGIAKLTLGQGPSQIPRQNKARRVDIDAPLIGATALGDVLGEVTQIMNGYRWPAGYRWQYGPSVTANNDTFGALTLVVILAVALIYMLLASQFESFLDPLVIMMAVPFALIGIIASLWITHRAFGLTAFIGSLMLVGIAVKNAIPTSIN